jgi:hypothetical protein
MTHEAEGGGISNIKFLSKLTRIDKSFRKDGDSQRCRDTS